MNRKGCRQAVKQITLFNTQLSFTSRETTTQRGNKLPRDHPQGIIPQPQTNNRATLKKVHNHYQHYTKLHADLFATKTRHQKSRWHTCDIYRTTLPGKNILHTPPSRSVECECDKTVKEFKVSSKFFDLPSPRTAPSLAGAWGTFLK